MGKFKHLEVNSLCTVSSLEEWAGTEKSCNLFLTQKGSRMRITTILFDLSEVLLSGLYGTHELLSAHLNQTITDEMMFTPELERFFLGKATENAYWRSLIEKYGWNITVPELRQMVRKNFREIPGTRDIIIALRERRYRLGLLSVHGEEWVVELEAMFRFHHLFDVICFSHEAKCCKPDPASFMHALACLDAKPEETVFIDDSSRNVSAAEALGIRGIHFTNAAALANRLAELGV